MMTRRELVQAFAEAHNLQTEQARQYLDTLLGCITGALASGRPVALDGFGVFRLRHRDARTTTNPATGKTMVIEATNVPTFKSWQALRKAVNEPSLSV